MSSPGHDELDSLRAENRRLISLLESHGIEWRLPPPPAKPVPEPEPSRLSISEKVALFRRLFRGRADVYPVRWESNTTGKAGYSPTRKPLQIKEVSRSSRRYWGCWARSSRGKARRGMRRRFSRWSSVGGVTETLVAKSDVRDVAGEVFFAKWLLGRICRDHAHLLRRYAQDGSV